MLTMSRWGADEEEVPPEGGGDLEETIDEVRTLDQRVAAMRQARGKYAKEASSEVQVEAIRTVVAMLAKLWGGATKSDDELEK